MDSDDDRVRALACRLVNPGGYILGATTRTVKSRIMNQFRLNETLRIQSTHLTEGPTHQVAIFQCTLTQFQHKTVTGGL